METKTTIGERIINTVFVLAFILGIIAFICSIYIMAPNYNYSEIGKLLICCVIMPVVVYKIYFLEKKIEKLTKNN